MPAGEWCALRLSMGEREEISGGIAGGESFRSMALRLSRSASTVSREVAANGGRDRYRAVAAHRGSRRRAQRPKAMKLEECPRLRQVVEDKLELWWSPAQISLWLKSAYPDDEEMRVSHESIYQSLFRPRGEALCVRNCGVRWVPGGRDAAGKDVLVLPRARSVTW